MTLTGLPTPVKLTTRAARRTPAAVAVRVTAIEQLAPLASVEPAHLSLEIANSATFGPLRLELIIGTGFGLTLVRVTEIGGLVDPTATPEKLTEGGKTLIAGGSPILATEVPYVGSGPLENSPITQTV